MSEILKICGICVLCTAAGLVLRSVSGSFSDIFKVCSSLAVCGALLVFASPIVEFVLEVSSSSSTSVYLTVMLKSLGVVFLTHVCAGVCRDCGEGTLGSYVELAGKIQIIIIALPLMREILGVARELVDMI